MMFDDYCKYNYMFQIYKLWTVLDNTLLMKTNGLINHISNLSEVLLNRIFVYYKRIHCIVYDCTCQYIAMFPKKT